MSRIHAIDGGIFGHALCEEPTGDTVTHERDVTCSDCLDIVDAYEVATMKRLIAAGFVYERIPGEFTEDGNDIDPNDVG